MSNFENGSSGTKLLNTTSLTGYFKPGVGSGEDLKVKIKKDPVGKWFPMIHKGWYYKDEEERYLFAKRIAQPFNYNQPGEIMTFTLSSTASLLPKTVDVGEVGPVFIEATGRYFNRVCCTLEPYMTRTWTNVIAGIWVTTLPSSSDLLHSVTCTQYGEMMPVPSSGMLKSGDQYYYDRKQNKVYIAYTGSKANPNAVTFLTYTTYPSSVSGKGLWQKELLVVDADSKVRVRYPTMDRDSVELAYRPIVTLLHLDPTETTINETGDIASGYVGTGLMANEIDVTKCIPFVDPGDTLKLSYMVDDSYCVVGDKLYMYAAKSCSGNFVYEGSQDDYQDLSSMIETDASYLQLNPIYSGVDSGFLFLAEDQSTRASARADRFYVTVSPVRSMIASSTAAVPCGPPIRVLGKLVDKDGIPVGQVQTSITVPAPLKLASTFPSGGKTNWNGEVVYTLQSTGACSGGVTVSAKVSGSTNPNLSGSAVVTVLNMSAAGMNSPTPYNASTVKVFLFADKAKVNAAGQIPVYFTVTHRAGVPYCVPMDVTITSRNSSFSGQLVSADGITVRTNPNGIGSVLYNLSGADILQASATVSGVTVYSNNYEIGT